MKKYLAVAFAVMMSISLMGCGGGGGGGYSSSDNSSLEEPLNL